MTVIHYSGNLSNVAGNGSAGYQDGNGESAQFCVPWGIALVEDGSLLVADRFNIRIRHIKQKGAISLFSECQISFLFLISEGKFIVETLAGCGIQGDDDGPPLQCKFHSPTGICVDNNTKTCYVTEFSNHRIRKFLFK